MDSRAFCAPNGCQSHRHAPTCPCVSIDPASLAGIAEALAKGPPIYSQPTPRLAPPFNAKTWTRYAIAVIAPNAATGDAGAILGATALATAESAARMATIAVLTPATVTEAVALFTEQQPNSQACRVAKIGFRVHSSQRAIRFSVLKGGTPVNDSQAANSGLIEPSDFADLDDPMDFYVDVGPTEIVAVTARNLDLLSGYLVETRLWGWTYPTAASGPGSSQAASINRQIGPDGSVR